MRWEFHSQISCENYDQLLPPFRAHQPSHRHLLMPNPGSDNKLRAREAPLRRWRAEVIAKLQQVRAELGLVENEQLSDRVLVEEIVLLAHPDAVSGVESPIPAPRLDLVSRWLHERLAGQADTVVQREDLARKLAPPPDEHLIPRFDAKTEKTRYSSTQPEHEDVAKAVKSYVASKRRRANQNPDEWPPWPNLL
jgi:hypothetical protein